MGQTDILILLALAILACAFTRAPEKTKPPWSQHFKGWQKLFGFVAVILAVLIIINPELLALGLLGDTVFFDALVLLLSLQLQTIATRWWRRVRPVCSKTLRLMIPRNRMSLSYLALALAPIANAASAIRKAVHHLSS